MTSPAIALGEVFEFIRNGKSIKQDKSSGGLPITRIETIADGFVNPNRVGFADIEEAGNEKWLLKPGDILFSHINSVAHIGKTALYEGQPEKLLHGMNLLALRPAKNLLDARYAFHAMNNPVFRASLQHFVNKAVNQASITTTNLKSLEIPLPPLDEQRRIAAILDKADALRRKRKRAVELLDVFTQSIFLEMFGDPETNPKGWKRGHISDLLEATQYGTSDKAGENGKFPILRMGNLTSDGRMDFTSLKYIDLGEKELDKYTVRRGDILFNRTNSADLVGKTAVFDRDERFAFAGYLVRARARPGVSPHYIASYLNSQHGKATLRGMAKSIVGMANINAKEMQSIPILIPDAKTQISYSNILASIEMTRTVSGRHMQLMDTSFASLQHRAFSGQL